MMLATLAAVHDAREAVPFGNPFTDFGLLLQELRKILEGKDADRAAVAQAKGFMEAIDNANQETKKDAARAAGIA
jgi:hypothetical protein